MDYSIKKYPRTPHLEGSRLQKGDEDISRIPFDSIRGRHLVVEEKIDGANVGLSFDDSGKLFLQSRGHYLAGGAREAHYDLYKQWASVHSAKLYDVLGSRYVVYGEWMYAKHKLFYDALPHYFIEFDVFDRERGVFLDTPSRQDLLSPLPICSVPILKQGTFDKKDDITSLITSSCYTTPNCLDKLKQHCTEHGLDVDDVMSTTDTAPMMEGVYIKIEENGCVTDRLKYVRADYVQHANVDTQEWLKKTIVPNQLAVPFDSIFDNKN